MGSSSKREQIRALRAKNPRISLRDIAGQLVADCVQISHVGVKNALAAMP